MHQFMESISFAMFVYEQQKCTFLEQYTPSQKTVGNNKAIAYKIIYNILIYIPTSLTVIGMHILNSFKTIMTNF